MMHKHYDKIHITDLLLPCIIGLRDWERTTPQNVNLNITLFTDFSRACESDEIVDTVDYVTIKKAIIKEVEASSFKLVEKLAQMIAEICLRDERVMRVDVHVGKPGALRFARTVAVEITRTRE